MTRSNPFSRNHPEVMSEKYIVFASHERRYLACSPGMCELTGYGEKEFLSKTVDQLSFFKFDAPDVFGRFLRQGALNGLHLLRHKDGHPVTVRYKAWPLVDGCLAAVFEPADKWQQAYYAALLELHPTKVRAACEHALAEVEFHRIMDERSGKGTDALRRELNRAAMTLRRRLLDLT